MRLTQAQLAHLWVNAGGSPREAQTASAVAMAESHGNMRAINYTDPYGGSFCAWQINGTHPFLRHELLHNPYYCATAAVYVRHLQGWSAWSTHADGSYLRYMPTHHYHRHHMHRVVHATHSDVSYASAFGGYFGFVVIVFTLARKLKEACLVHPRSRYTKTTSGNSIQRRSTPAVQA